MPERSENLDSVAAALETVAGPDGLPLELAWDKWPPIICRPYVPHIPDPNRSWMRKLGELVGICRSGNPFRSRQLD